MICDCVYMIRAWNVTSTCYRPNNSEHVISVNYLANDSYVVGIQTIITHVDAVGHLPKSLEGMLKLTVTHTEVSRLRIVKALIIALSKGKR